MNAPQHITDKYALIEQTGGQFRCTPQQPLRLSSSFGYEQVLAELEERLSAHDTSNPTAKRVVGATCTLDMAGVGNYDSYCVVWLAHIKKLCKTHGIGLRIEGMSDALTQFVVLLEKPVLTAASHPETVPATFRSSVVHLGEITLRVLADARAVIEFVGEFVISIARMLTQPHRIASAARWADVPVQFHRAGAGAVPIVTLIGFLMGLIIGYQGAVQLAQFGADIYLADMVAISMTRELAPLMTAIIIAGRSGAAFAAEIGTMQVSEEVDALRAMGFNIMRFLVLPRVIAVTLAMPLLVLFSDVGGIIGGTIIGTTVSKISLSGYLNETQYALTYWHLFTGLIKSLALGVIIAVIGCMRGLQVRGGAESVGNFTTLSVVTSIFLIIVADALFTLIFQALGI
jgi:phospholipid/cholesterol/gamma-HCH transport system permease protein